MAIYLGDLELATGGGATGTGLPVNTYESFEVGVTGNPSGYNATTGLYTHPNGDYWLKTGNTITGATVGTTYPDAYQINALPTGATYTGFSFTVGTSPTGIVGFGGNFYVVERSANLLKEYNSTGVATGFSFSQANDAGVHYDGTNFVFNGSTNVVQYDAAGVATGFTFASGQAGQWGITSNGSNYFVAQGNTVRGFDLAGTATGFTFTAPTQAEGLSFDGSYFWTSNESAGRVYASTATGANTGFSFSTATNAPDPAGVWSNGTNIYVTDNNLRKVFEYAFVGAGKTVGDAAAKTDTDSGQPLFIKLK